MAAPTQLTVSIDLARLDPKRVPQDVACLLRALASLIDASGTYPDRLRSSDGSEALTAVLT